MTEYITNPNNFKILNLTTNLNPETEAITTLHCKQLKLAKRDTFSNKQSHLFYEVLHQTQKKIHVIEFFYENCGHTCSLAFGQILKYAQLNPANSQKLQ